MSRACTGLLAQAETRCAAWLVAHDISQPAEPDVGPLKPHSLCIYYREDALPATKPTSDVPLDI
jgi:hypothetical protein